MDLEGFKKIFYVEWLHRGVGSGLGAIFAFPLLYFWGRGYLKPRMKKRMLLLLGLGASQGLIGWWMVKSGMKEKPDYQSRPRVSVYRLFIHLNTAIVIYSLLLWNGLTLLRKPIEMSLRPEHYKANKILRGKVILLLHFVALNIASGACAAGIDAMKVFNDWPLYNGGIVPPNLWESEKGIRNFFENKSLVQFNHRNFGALTFLWTIHILNWTIKQKSGLAFNHRLGVYLLGGIVGL